MNASPLAPIASASPSDPETGSPENGSARHSRTDIARLAVTAVSGPAVSAACRPTAWAPTSSRRPASSSPLVCLITMKIVISAPKMAAQTPYRQTVRAPIEDPYRRP